MFAGPVWRMRPPATEREVGLEAAIFKSVLGAAADDAALRPARIGMHLWTLA